MAAGKEYPISLVVKAVDKATGPLRGIAAKISGLPSLAKRLGGGLGDLSKRIGLNQIGPAVGKVHEAASNVVGEVAKIGAVAGGAVFGLAALIKASSDAGDALAKSADRVGLSVDAYAQLSFVAGRAGVSQEEFTVAMDQYSKAVGNARANTGPLYSLLKSVSPVLLQQVKAAKSSEAAFDLMMHALAKIQDPAKRAALAAAAFGRSGMKMSALVQHGVGEIAELRAEYVRIAGSQEKYARGSEDLNDAIGDVTTAFGGLASSVMGELNPVFTDLAKRVKEFIVANRAGIAKWATDSAAAISAWVKGGGIERLVQNLKDFTARAAEVIDKVGGMKVALGAVAAVIAGSAVASIASLIVSMANLTVMIAGVVASLDKLAFGQLVADLADVIPMIASGTSVMEAFNLVLAANPIGLVITAIGLLAGAAYLIYKHWDPIKAFFKDLWDGLVSGVKKAWAYLEPIFEKIGKFILKITGISGMIEGWKQLKHVFGGRGSSSGSDAGASAPTLGAASVAPPPSARGGDVNVNVSFKDVPKGVRINQDNKSDAPVNMSAGYSMAGGV